MTITVRQRADTIGTLRYASVFAMETLAQWVPTTPDLEVKILFGRHIWEFAQHADALGKRTHELRAALHYTVAPLPEYAESLALLRGTDGARERVEAFYDAFLPDLEHRYRRFLAATDPFLDEPSVRIVERILTDLSRMVSESAETRAERVAMTTSGAPTAPRLRQALEDATEFVKHRAPAGSVAESLA
jgi:hypothetical protein